MFMKYLSRDGQMKAADFSFALMGVFGVLGLIGESFDSTPRISSAPDPIVTALGALLLALTIGIIITKVASLDRNRSEEYTFQLMSNGAIVAVMTTMLVTFLWQTEWLLGRWLGSPSSDHILALLLGSWSIGYFTYRAKGVAE